MFVARVLHFARTLHGFRIHSLGLSILYAVTEGFHWTNAALIAYRKQVFSDFTHDCLDMSVHIMLRFLICNMFVKRGFILPLTLKFILSGIFFESLITLLGLHYHRREEAFASPWWRRLGVNVAVSVF